VLNTAFCTSGTGAKRRVEHKSSSRAQDAEKFPVANLLVFYVRSAPLQSNDSSGKSRNNMNAVWRGCDELNLTEGWSRDWRRDDTRDLVEQNWRNAPSRAFLSVVANGGSGFRFRGGSAASSVREVRDVIAQTGSGRGHRGHSSAGWNRNIHGPRWAWGVS